MGPDEPKLKPPGRSAFRAGRPHGSSRWTGSCLGAAKGEDFGSESSDFLHGAFDVGDLQTVQVPRCFSLGDEDFEFMENVGHDASGFGQLRFRFELDEHSLGADVLALIGQVGVGRSRSSGGVHKPGAEVADMAGWAGASANVVEKLVRHF